MDTPVPRLRIERNGCLVLFFWDPSCQRVKLSCFFASKRFLGLEDPQGGRLGPSERVIAKVALYQTVPMMVYVDGAAFAGLLLLGSSMFQLACRPCYHVPEILHNIFCWSQLQNLQDELWKDSNPDGPSWLLRFKLATSTWLGSR